MKQKKYMGLYTPYQLQILTDLFKNQTKNLSLKELGSYTNSHHLHTLKSLVRQGLVDRIISEEGERTKYKITKSGIEEFSFIKQSLLDINPDYIQGPKQCREEFLMYQKIVISS